VPATLQLVVEVIDHDVGQQRRERRPCGVPSSLACQAPSAITPSLKEAPPRREHRPVADPPRDPRHQRVVLDTIKERVQIDVHHPRRVITDELACRLDRLMRRTAGPKPDAVVTEVRLKQRFEHAQHGLLDQPIQRRRHPQRPLPTARLGDHHPAHRLRSIGARIKHRADLRPMDM
jgi:hypothetical protein